MNADALPHAVAVQRQCHDQHVPEGRELARAIGAVERARIASQNADRRHDVARQRVGDAMQEHTRHRNAASEVVVNTARSRANRAELEAREAAKVLVAAESDLVRALDAARAALSQVAA